MPLYWTRQLGRGYNQAALLARELGRLHSIPCAGLLRRSRPTRPQVGLRRDPRKLNLRGAFEALPETAGLRVLLVDDVITTGTTLNSAAAALKRAGAAEVHCLAVARALR
ncbi:MAG: DNA utilization protein GntX [Deltaproteobacteria bacterium ADurb.Bin510]|nr:MAG: DNA utilization protein GntX [Deltaproteobacteria bacterium ADurb.Bin510]